MKVPTAILTKRGRARKTALLVSMLLFPITLNYFSPYLIVNGSFEGVASGSLLLFAGLFLSGFFFGRAFCGWVCPAGALQEVCAGINPKAASPRQNAIKYVLWVPWIGSIIAGFVTSGGLKRIDPVYMTDNGISVAAPTGYFVYFAVILLIVGLSLAFGRRSFCHSVCWMAPFMLLGSRVRARLNYPALRLQAQPERCTGCNTCTRNCPMSLDVKSMVQSGRTDHDECILCGTCGDVCPKGAVDLRFGCKRREEQDEQRKYDGLHSAGAASARTDERVRS